MSDNDKAVKEQDFKSLLQTHAVNVPKEGEVIKGKVIFVDRGEIHIDIEGMTTGVVRGQELFAEAREYANLKVGDEVEATVVELENENGEMELSFRIAGYQKAWDGLRKWMKDNITLKAKVLGANKGGLMMQVEAMQGFMPVSQLSPDNYPRVAGGDKNRILDKLRELVGKELEVKVIDADEKEEKLIVSERAVWEDSQKAVLESYKIGDVVDGEVSALTSFGAFIKFGEGLEGLVHISEIAWQRIDHPKDMLKVGDKVKAQIIQLDHSKIYLSIKRIVEDPWKSVKEKYKVGDKVKGKILKIETFGLMVGLDKEIHGLAHISEVSDEPIANLHDKFKVGQELELEIVSLEPTEHRLGLKLAGVKGKSGRKASASAPADAKALAGKKAAADKGDTKDEPVAKAVVDKEDTKPADASVEAGAGEEEVK
ncbi:MAG TPA: S1 RNA-binding domain-containing protein [Patescibacteria group bacterium]|nr:S1 RNA-binding domain-containing protein [Patescibacteria group bacterium]